MSYLVEVGPVVLEKKTCISSMYFFSYNHLPLDPYLPMDAFCQVWLKLRQWFLFLQCIFAISYYLPLKEGGALHLINFESPLPKVILCQVWLKLARRFWRRRFLNFVNVFSLFHNYIPLERGRALHLNKLESPSPSDTLCHVLLKLAQWFLRRR